MTNNAKHIAKEIDKVSEGFKRVEVAERPPKIKWGDTFHSWPDQKKIKYLMKFAEAMNHAAYMVQKERDELGKLAELKEEQLMQMQSMMDANNRMLQSEVTKMNDYRQQAQDHAAKQEARIRELESGDNG